VAARAPLEALAMSAEAIKLALEELAAAGVDLETVAEIECYSNGRVKRVAFFRPGDVDEDPE
jgi:hypothetical protein